MNTGEVKGLPRFKLYRQFIEGLEYEFHRVEMDDARKRELVNRIEQIERVMPEEFNNFFETFMSRARVVEVRHYGADEWLRYEVVEYAGACVECSTRWTQGVHLLVQYDREGKLLSYTFPSRDPEPMRTKAWLSGLKEQGSTHWEDVIDYMCDRDRFAGLFVSPEKSKSHISVWHEDEESDWLLEWAPYGMELFRIERSVEFQCDALEFVKTYMRDGTSDTLMLYDDWGAVHQDGNMAGHHIDISGFLTARYLRAQRKGGAQWLKLIKTLEACGIDGDSKHCLKYSECVPHDGEWNMMQAVYRKAKKDREVGEEECYRQKMLYLALHKHDDACREIAQLFTWLEPDEDRELWDFWQDKEAEAAEELWEEDPFETE